MEKELFLNKHDDLKTLITLITSTSLSQLTKSACARLFHTVPKKRYMFSDDGRRYYRPVYLGL